MYPVIKPLARQASLHRTVQDAIRAYILDNNLGAGDPLPPETDFARQLGISRNSVREAVKSLESLGILETRRGAGLFVRAFSFEPLLDNLSYGLLFDRRELAELLEIRRVLEVGLIERALASMPAATRTALRQVVDRMGSRAEQGENFPEEDREFHRLLFAHIGNGSLLKLLDVYWLALSKASSRHADISRADPVPIYRDHLAIAEAVAANDVAGARAALDRHYANLGDRLQRDRAQPRTAEQG